MDPVELLKPNIRKVVLTLVLPGILGLLSSFSLHGVIAVYGFLLTPGFTLYADGAYYEWNIYILAWIPLYLGACLFDKYLSNRNPMI